MYFIFNFKKEVINLYHKKDSEGNFIQKKKMNIVLKIFLIIFIPIVIIAITIFSTIYIYLNNKLGKIQYDELKKADVFIDDRVDSELSGKYRTIALLGIDARSDTFNRGNRSDCIMLISLNEKTGDVKIASVYRDTYLDIDNRGLDKVTHAYSFGEAQLALSTLNKNLDLNIYEYVAINFDTVRTIVNEIGGVQMYITDEEAKHIFGISSAGTYNLNGEQALAYGRIRKASGGDYKRTERMREVLIAVFDKAKKMNVASLNHLLDVMLPHVRTNIQKNEIISFIPKIASYNVNENFGWPYNTSGQMINGVWYGMPHDLESDVSKLHKQLFNQDNYQVSEKVHEISEKIKVIDKIDGDY